MADAHYEGAAWYLEAEEVKLWQILDNMLSTSLDVYSRKSGFDYAWNRAMQSRRHVHPYFNVQTGRVDLTQDVQEPEMLGSGVSGYEIRVEHCVRDDDVLPWLMRTEVIAKRRDLQTEIRLPRHYFQLLRVSILRTEGVFAVAPRNWRRMYHHSGYGCEDEFWMYGEFGDVESYVNDPNRSGGVTMIPPEMWWNNTGSRRLDQSMPLVMASRNVIFIRLEMIHLPKQTDRTFIGKESHLIVGAVIRSDLFSKTILSTLMSHMNAMAMVRHLENECMDMFVHPNRITKFQKLAQDLELDPRIKVAEDQTTGLDFSWKAEPAAQLGSIKVIQLGCEEMNPIRKRKRQEMDYERYNLREIAVRDARRQFREAEEDPIVNTSAGSRIPKNRKVIPIEESYPFEGFQPAEWWDEGPEVELEAGMEEILAFEQQQEQEMMEESATTSDWDVE